MSIFAVILFIFAASQAYWALRVYRLAVRLFPNPVRRMIVCGAVVILYAAAFWGGFPSFARGPSPIELTLKEALVDAPFLVWMASSLVGFLLVALIAIPQGI